MYDRFNEEGRFSLLRYKMFGRGTKLNSDGVVISELMPFWTYRRILDKAAFNDERIANDVAVINWYSNDFADHNIIDKPPAVVWQHLRTAKALSLGFLYWLQTEVLRDDGGKGYPELRLKIDALGTTDGLSKYPYIRESRRGRAVTVVKEADMNGVPHDWARARIFDDSVGIGYFPIDIHGKEAAPGTLTPTKHFQIPLGALIMDCPSNLILSAKNIGTTHVTNGAYRLHPIEWAIGEAAGTLACFALKGKTALREVLNDVDKLRSLQISMIEAGVPLYWYDDVATTDEPFTAVQFLAVTDIMRGDFRHLHFDPAAILSESEMAELMAKAAEKYKGIAATARPPILPACRGSFAIWLFDQIKPLMSLRSLTAAQNRQ